MAFRLNAAGFFLTYPQCNGTKEGLLDFLKSLKEVNKAIVCRELHEDGKPHLHAFVKYTRKLDIRKPNYFDFQGSHGNYQVAKSYFAVCKYVRKGDDILEYNMDAKAEEDCRINHKKILGRRLMEAATPLDVASIIEDEPELLFGAAKLR